ncbi:hypothetical protein F5Y04DRAFT_41010 [Hypomontagnella monticulosa]|nr:hypothetical protein F5Y04DRAFT_41010 [Hypomontagnella monticulosa]
MFSPLVCPQGWNAVKTWTNGYIACCASGFFLHEPDPKIDENRPAYGGTCYSSLQVGQIIKATAYNSASVTGTVDWVASATDDQVYAHPIDGYQAEIVDNSPSSKLSGGAIAGIVIGSIAGLIAILLAMLFLLRRYRRKKQQTAFDVSQQFPYGNQYGQWNKEYPETPITGNFQSPYDSTGGTFNSSSPSYRTNQRFELGCPEPRELDSGWPGRELESREVAKSLPEIPKHEGG